MIFHASLFVKLPEPIDIFKSEETGQSTPVTALLRDFACVLNVATDACKTCTEMCTLQENGKPAL